MTNITHCTTGKERFLYCIILPHAVNASLYKLCNHCGAMTIYTRTLTTSSASQVPGWVKVIWIHVMFEIKIKFTV